MGLAVGSVYRFLCVSIIINIQLLISQKIEYMPIFLHIKQQQ
jgi:hypothetical protein